MDNLVSSSVGLTSTQTLAGNGYVRFSNNILINWGSQSLSTSITSSAWEQPTLTSNGTLGTSNFAVSATQYSSSWKAYYAFDNNNDTAWQSKSGESPTIMKLYTQNAIKITKMVWTNYSTSYNITDITVSGSSDDTTYTNITSQLSTSSSTQTITLSNSNFYNYYKLQITPQGYTSVRQITITATEQVAAGGGTDTIYLPQAHSTANYVPLLSFVGTSGKYAQQHYFSAVKTSYFTLKSTTTGDTVMRYITVGY